jgi:hypothetical protein
LPRKSEETHTDVDTYRLTCSGSSAQSQALQAF